MKKAGKILIITGILFFSASVILKVIFPAGVNVHTSIFKFSFHNHLKPMNFSFNLIFAGIALIYIQRDSWPDWKMPALLFFVFSSFLKILRYEFFLAPGYDLGNYVSILHNIYHHGRLFDSLNQVHAFRGHIRPFLFPLSLLFLIKESPITLLVVQSGVIALTVPVLLKLSKFYHLGPDAARILIALFLSNVYLHHVNGFDFHLEALAIPLILLGIYLFEKGDFLTAIIVMILTLTFKEDIAITWLSVGIFYLLVRGDRRRGVMIAGISVFYGLIAAYLIFRFVELPTMQEAHYSSLPHFWEALKSGLKFLGSLGFLPLFVPGTIVAWILPLLEHLTSSRPNHYKIQYQYAANLIPAVFWSVTLTLRKNSGLKKVLAVSAILFSVFQSPVKLYIDLSKVSFSRKVCIEGVLSEITVNAKVSCGNHISPHMATRDGVFQFPIIDDADVVVLDTTWHDFTPVSEDSARKIIKTLEKEFHKESRCGLLIFRRKGHSVFSGFLP